MSGRLVLRRSAKAKSAMILDHPLVTTNRSGNLRQDNFPARPSSLWNRVVDF